MSSTIYRVVHGLDRGSDSALGLSSGLALVCLILGGSAGCYSLFLSRRRLAGLGIVLCVLAFVLSLVVGKLFGGHS
jgi:hypothetical protein